METFRKEPNAKKVYHLNENLSNFLGKEYLSPSLAIGVDIMYGNDSEVDDIISDIDGIESTLEGLLAQNRNYSFVDELLDMIDVGKNVDGDYQSRQKFLANVYFSYGDYIKLDPSIISIAKDSIARKSSFLAITRGGNAGSKKISTEWG